MGAQSKFGCRISTGLAAALLLVTAVPAQTRTRTELAFPDLPGFVTLRCDFHMHTVFSDGNVWPTVRVEEAWRSGLDAIALTDHLEYQPHKSDVSTNYARSYEIARGAAQPLGLILLRSAEITRGEPPGHMNAIGITNAAVVNQKDNAAAVSNAFLQGAFLFWNHPGWKQPQNKSVWYKEQDQYLEYGWLRGIEIVNGTDYDPIAHQWCVEKKLTLLGDSDTHDPISFDYGATPAELRPMTLVFAKERSTDAIKEALFARRTVVVSQGRMYGDAEFLSPLFQGSIEVVNPEIRIRGKGRALVQIRNKAPVNFECRLNPKLPECDVPDKLLLVSGKVSLLEVRCVSDRVTGEQHILLPCKVLNLVVEPNRGLTTTLPLKIKFEPGS
jgi:3',5'-nucleoside bisphosphate phosphatase